MGINLLNEYIESTLSVNHRLLDKVETSDLVILAQTGDQKAMDMLIRHNQRLIVSIARRYITDARHIDLDDLIQAGNIGLITAVNKFESHFGTCLSTYATQWIKAYIRRFLELNHKFDISVRDVFEIGQINRYKSSALNVYETEPGALDIAESTGIPVNRVKFLLVASKIQVLSLEMERNDSDGVDDLHTIIADDEDIDIEEEIIRNELWAEVKGILDSIDNRLNIIINLRFGLDGHGYRTLQEVGDIVGLTRARVGQLESNALSIIKLKYQEHKSNE